jgi:hypothetical protein
LFIPGDYLFFRPARNRILEEFPKSLRQDRQGATRKCDSSIARSGKPESATQSDIRVTFAKWRRPGRALIEVGVICMKPCSQFVALFTPMSAFLGANRGQQEIVRWIRILKNDALRLRRFEKDDLVLVIGAIRGVRNETPIAAGARSADQ